MYVIVIKTRFAISKEICMLVNLDIFKKLTSTIFMLLLAEGIAAEIERYSDRYRTDIRANRSPLNSVLKLAPGFFPAELLGQGQTFSDPFMLP
jgi:hypothetical protein